MTSGMSIWLMAARPRTLPAAIAPVLVGSAAAWWEANEFRWGAFVAALIGSIFIQIGTNLANDYSDAKRGADTADRLGPVRVTSSGLVAPRRVLYATWLAFGVATVAGIYLATVAGWVIILVGLASIAADNACFGQTGPRVGSWDGGFGASLLRDLVGTKKAKEFWMLCRQYDAGEVLEMGLINAVVPVAELERETVAWCREMLALSPFALRLVKASFNAHEDGYAGIQQLAHDANLLFYMTEEGQEGRNAYVEGREPDFGKYPRRP